MSPYKQARAIYCSIKDDPGKIRAKRQEFAAAAAGITSADGGFQITSANVNGQNFTGTNSSTAESRFEVLSILIGMLDRKSAGSSTVIGKFL